MSGHSINNRAINFRQFFAVRSPQMTHQNDLVLQFPRYFLKKRSREVSRRGVSTYTDSQA